MTAATYQSLPSQVIFGKGALARAGEVMAGFGCRRVLVLATRSQEAVAGTLCQSLGEAGAGVFSRAAMHTPVEVTAQAMEIVEAERIDGLIAVGGGSAIGLGKAIALRTDLPQLVIPTTYAGSEMTPVVGQTEGGKKTTQRSPKVLPEAVIYDVELTLGLPVPVSVTSGFNAMAHAVEALYAKAPTPLLLAFNAPAAPEAIARLGRALQTDLPADSIFDLAASLGAPRALRDIGMPEAGIAQAVATVLAEPAWNPRPVESEALTAMLRRAWAGEGPG